MNYAIHRSMRHSSAGYAGLEQRIERSVIAHPAADGQVVQIYSYASTAPASARDAVAAFVVAVNHDGVTFVPQRAFDGADHYYVEWIMQPHGIPGVSVGTLRDGKIVTNNDDWNYPRSAQPSSDVQLPSLADLGGSALVELG